MKDFRARRWQQEDRNPMMTVFEKAGRYPDIIDLSIGDPDLKTPQKIIDLAFADAGAGHTKYTDPWGDPELREEIARFYAEEYGVALGEREIFCLHGRVRCHVPCYGGHPGPRRRGAHF